MITEQQLIHLVSDHIYFFTNEIQANHRHSQGDSVIFSRNHQMQVSKQKLKMSLIHQHEQVGKREGQLKLDLWKINEQLDSHNHNLNSKDQYIGPILSFQRRQIWSKNNENHRKNIQEQRQSKNITKLDGEENSRIVSQNHYMSKILSNTVANNYKPNTLLNTKKTDNLLHHHESNNLSSNSKYSKSIDQTRPTQHISKSRPVSTSIQNSIISRKNHYLVEDSRMNSRIDQSTFKRRHKIFSLSSKTQNTNNQKNLLGEKGHNRTSFYLLRESRQHSPNYHQIGNKPANIQNQHVSMNQNEEQSIHYSQKQNMNYQNKNRVKTQSDHSNIFKQKQPNYQTVFNARPETSHSKKQRPSSQYSTLTQTDYVPSPQELSTILRTIQKQSRMTQNSRKSTNNNKKSLYLKRLNNSIRYHQQNLYQPVIGNINVKTTHNKQQYIPVHPNAFYEPSLIDNRQKPHQVISIRTHQLLEGTSSEKSFFKKPNISSLLTFRKLTSF